MIISIVKYAAFIVFAFLGVVQIFVYFRLKKMWSSLPVVAATVTESRLLHSNIGGTTEYEAIIVFSYSFRGREYESKTPALRSVQVFPLYGYESELLDKYKKGEMYNARVFPNLPDTAYLEVAPLSKLSMFLFPIMTLGMLAYFIGLGIFFSKLFTGI
jgi:hypothetical protein